MQVGSDDCSRVTSKPPITLMIQDQTTNLIVAEAKCAYEMSAFFSGRRTAVGRREKFARFWVGLE